MTDEIKKAIDALAKQTVAEGATPEAAMKISQAALNLAHTAATLNNINPSAR